MSSTVTRDDRTLDQASTPAAPQFVPPPKLRRRPALVAGAVVAICLGAILAAWAWTSTTHTKEVLAARTTIARGSVIGAADLQRVRINADPALHPLPASAYDDVVGKRAALDISAGGLLTADVTTSSALPPSGMSVVGIALTTAQAPALRLQSGDRVRIVVTPGQGGDQPSGAPQVTAARVVDSGTDPANAQTVVDVLVPYADASVLAARAATGNVALVLDSGGK